MLAICAVAGLAFTLITLRMDRRRERRERREAALAEKDSARDEALALAEARQGVINDQRERIQQLESRISEMRADMDRERRHHDKAIERLEESLKQQREDAAETQRMIAVGMHGVLVKLLDHLEASPPQVEEAIAYLRDCLTLQVSRSRPS